MIIFVAHDLLVKISLAKEQSYVPIRIKSNCSMFVWINGSEGLGEEENMGKEIGIKYRKGERKKVIIS